MGAVVEKEYQQHLSVRDGVNAGLAIAIGYTPIAFTYGLLAKAAGLSLWETVAMSIFVFAGASQYIALSLLAASTSSIEILITTFIMNIRHLLMSASLNERAEPDKRWIKAIYAFMVTDESFAVASTRSEEKLSSRFLIGLGVIGYSSWVLFSGIGYITGAGLPEVVQNSMGIALYAMFIGLLVPAAKKSRKIIGLAATAAIFNIAFSQYEPLAGGWGIILSTIISAVGMELILGEEKNHA